MSENILSGESNILEYKEEIPEDNKKWLKTVVAFANGKGGKIVFGIKDGTFEVKGIDETRFNVYRSLNRSNLGYTEVIAKDFGLKDINTEEDDEKFGLNSEEYTETEYRILKEIAAHPTVTKEEFSQIIGIIKRAVEIQMKKLREKNLIERIGSKKTGFYLIVRKEEK